MYFKFYNISLFNIKTFLIKYYLLNISIAVTINYRQTLFGLRYLMSSSVVSTSDVHLKMNTFWLSLCVILLVVQGQCWFYFILKSSVFLTLIKQNKACYLLLFLTKMYHKIFNNVYFLLTNDFYNFIFISLTYIKYTMKYNINCLIYQHDLSFVLFLFNFQVIAEQLA